MAHFMHVHVYRERGHSIIQPRIVTAFYQLTVTISPEPTFKIDSLSFFKESLNSFTSFRVHIEAAATGGSSSDCTQNQIN